MFICSFVDLHSYSKHPESSKDNHYELRVNEQFIAWYRHIHLGVSARLLEVAASWTMNSSNKNFAPSIRDGTVMWGIIWNLLIAWPKISRTEIRKAACTELARCHHYVVVIGQTLGPGVFATHTGKWVTDLTFEAHLMHFFKKIRKPNFSTEYFIGNTIQKRQIALKSTARVGIVYSGWTNAQTSNLKHETD